MSDERWTELDTHGYRIRWREREGEHALGAGVEVQKYSPKHGWRDVRSLQGRCWFEIGVAAATASNRSAEALMADGEIKDVY